MKPPVRHVSSINDLSNQEIEAIFHLADHYLKSLPDKNFPHRVSGSTSDASGFLLANLFYEPSTRTRLSFETAMLRLGGKTIASIDPLTSSASKGENLADSVRVIANYADAIVIRHPRDGAASGPDRDAGAHRAEGWRASGAPRRGVKRRAVRSRARAPREGPGD